MAVWSLWLVALLSIGLLLPQVSRGDEELSLGDNSLVKRDSCTSVYGYITCGDGCCDWGLFYCFTPSIGVPMCALHAEPCDAQCEASSCSVDTSYQASCLVDDTSPTPTPVSNDGASTTSSDPYGYYGAASTSDAGSSDTGYHHSSSSKSTKKSKKLPPKVIAGIVTGVVAFFSAIGAAFTWLFRRRKRTSAAPEASATAVPAEDGPPEYFKQPEPRVTPVSPLSDPEPDSAPQRY